ncbi:hypothetical protein [Streptomyces griseocarneus]|uniref:hypothetical protein n=1 Tax=Streptomyces griseocarneus TaxID=51201 RepID=UPI00167DF6A6|nr:hypothetical protein [Streptomyces griseocarneus]MBZ6476969.1 hypothetical protein [Streptomyces griseocarneus]GHG76426.1 hypothetical protein GCM10018779_54730 [Streptomyces griseocarneus]
MAATAAFADPLANTAGSFATFGSLLRQGTQAVRANARAVTAAARTLDRLARGGGPAGASVKRFGTDATATGRAIDRLGRTAGTATVGVAKGRTAHRQAARLVKDTHRESDATARTVRAQSKLAGTAGRLSGVLGGKLGIVTQVWEAVNLVMKGNPLVLLATVIMPVATQLIDFAMESDAGKAFMEKCFSGFETIMGPAFTGVMPVITGLAAAATVFEGMRRIVSDPVGFLRDDLPRGFQHFRDAMDRFLGGSGGTLRNIVDVVAAVLKFPVNCLIAIGNLVISAVNVLPGVNISKVPMLALGGIVTPRDGGVPVILAEAGETEVVLPLSRLDALLARTAEAARGAGPWGRGPRVEHYYEPEGRGSHGIAEDLLFLAQTSAQTRQTRR